MPPRLRSRALRCFQLLSVVNSGLVVLFLLVEYAFKQHTETYHLLIVTVLGTLLVAAEVLSFIKSYFLEAELIRLLNFLICFLNLLLIVLDLCALILVSQDTPKVPDFLDILLYLAFFILVIAKAFVGSQLQKSIIRERLNRFQGIGAYNI